MGPEASRSSNLRGFEDASDGFGGVDVLEVFSRGRSGACPRGSLEDHPQRAVRSGAMGIEHPQTHDPDGRLVVFDVGSRLHLARRRPWLLDHIDAILDTVARPDHRALDPTPDRERFYRQHIEPGRWLRVVVDYGQDPAWVVTAVEQDNDPRSSP